MKLANYAPDMHTSLVLTDVKGEQIRMAKKDKMKREKIFKMQAGRELTRSAY